MHSAESREFCPDNEENCTCNFFFFLFYYSVMAVSHLLHRSLISSFIFAICFNLAFKNTWKCGNSVLVCNETDYIALKAFNCKFGNHGRGKLYFSVRIPYSTNGMITYQASRRIVFSGDIQINSGPGGKRAPKYPCKQCEKNVRNNQNSLLCAECNVWSLAKCLGMSKTGFKRELEPKISLLYMKVHTNLD